MSKIRIGNVAGHKAVDAAIAKRIRKAIKRAADAVKGGYLKGNTNEHK